LSEFAGATSTVNKDDWPEGAWSGMAEGVAASGRGAEGAARRGLAGAGVAAVGAASKDKAICDLEDDERKWLCFWHYTS